MDMEIRYKSKEEWNHRIMKRTTIIEEEQHVRNFSTRKKESAPSLLCWKRIMDIFFSIKWKSIVILSIYISSFIVILRMQSRPERWMLDYMALEFVRLTCYIIYFVDTVIHFLHRSVEKFREVQTYMPHPVICIIVDVISLLPAELMFYSLPIPLTRLTFELGAMFAANSLLRVYRIPFFLWELEGHFQFNLTVVFLFGMLGICLVVLHFLEFIWLQVIGRWYGNEMTWIRYVQTLTTMDNSIEWYIISFTIVWCMFNRFFRGVIQPANNLERIMVATVWLLGLLVENGALLGGLLASLTVTYRLSYSFTEIMACLNNFLRIRDVHPKTKDRVEAYYQALWVRATGVKSSALFSNLPMALRKELLLDVFWDAFKHSHLLSVRSLALKRSLCMVMEYEYYLPGEMLFAKGKVKEKTVYIVSGVVEALSASDHKTPITYFTAGACLGEANLIYQLTSQHDVRCATFCVVQVLHIPDALVVLKDFPETMAKMSETMRRRIRHAQQVQENVHTFRPRQMGVLDEQSTSCKEIKWVKDSWRNLFKKQDALDQKTGDKGEWERHRYAKQEMHQPVGLPGEETIVGSDAYEETLDRAMHTYAFFDLFTLSEYVDSVPTSFVCSKTSFPWIFEKESDFKAVWNVILFSVIIYECYISPYYLSFHVDFPYWVTAWGILCDVLVTIDLYVTAHTAIDGENLKLSAILLHRLQTVAFFLKTLATVPWHWIFILLNAQWYNAMRVRYVRMIWAAKFLLWITHWARGLGGFAFLMKYGVCLLSFVYWMTCWQNLFNCYHGVCSGINWYTDFVFYEVSVREYKDILLRRVYTMILYCASAIMRNGFMLGNPMSLSDLALYNIMMTIGFVCSCYWLSEYCSMLLIHNRCKLWFRDLIATIDYYQFRTDLPNPLFNELARYLAFQWKANGAAALLEEGPSLEVTPRYLLDDLKEPAREAVRSIPLFSNARTELVEELASEVTFYECPKNMLVSRGGDHPAAIFVLRKGFCRCVSHWRPDVERNLTWTLNPGDCFPLMEALHRVPVMVSVRTESACVVASLEVLRFRAVMARFPDDERLLDSVVKQHERQWSLSDIPLLDPEVPAEKQERGKRARHRFMRHYTEEPCSVEAGRVAAARESSSSSSESSVDFDVYQDVMDEDEIDYEHTWAEERLLQLLRYVTCRRSRDPNSTFVFRWEIWRVAIALFAAIAQPMAYSALIDVPFFLVGCHLFDLYGLVDIYMRMQVGYYNEDGLLITHPIYAIKYYVKHSMAVDLLSCLPIELLPLSLVFQFQNTPYSRYWARLLRILPLYRFYQFMDYLEYRLTYRFLSSDLVKVIVTGFLTLHIVANGMLYMHCDVVVEGSSYFTKKDSVHLNCSFEYFLTDTFLKYRLKTPLQVYTLHLHYVLEMFAMNSVGLFLYQSGEILMTVFLGCVAYLTQMWLIANVVSIMAAKRWRITRSRNHLGNLVRFLRSEGADERLVRLAVECFEYEWRRRHSVNIPEVLGKIPPLLQADMLYARCRQTLKKMAPLHGAPERLLREISRNANIILLNVGRFIIRTNDVQEQVFILDKGRIAMIGYGNKCLKELNQGAMFGNLPRQLRMRQTLGVAARTHAIVISISNEILYSILDDFPEVLSQFDDINLMRLEFVPEYGYTNSMDDTGTDKRKMWPSSRKEMVEIYSIARKSAIRKTWARNIKNFRSFITADVSQRVARISIFYVTIPASFICTLAVITIPYEMLWAKVIIYICDGLYVVKILLKLWMPYTDQETGENVDINKLIRRKYIKDMWGFPIDAISTIPCELIWNWSWLYSNRLLRIISLIQYIRYLHNRLNVTALSRWVRCFLILIICLAILESLYVFVRCDQRRYCEYLVDVRNVHKSNFRVSTNSSTIIAIAYLITMNHMCSASFTEPPAYEVAHIIHSAFISLINFTFMLYFVVNVACLVHATRKYHSDYSFSVKKLSIFMKNLGGSMSLRQRIMEYVNNLWKFENGRSVPFLLENAPKDLRLDIMAVLYGDLLRKDPVLSRAHTDLLLQMTGYLRRHVYFPGDTIVEKDDINGCMFILQSGKVVAMMKDEFLTEKVMYVVPQGCIFSLKSGLYESEPHKYTYRSTTRSSVLSLNQKDWKYLLKYFPAAQEDIIEYAIHLTETY